MLPIVSDVPGVFQVLLVIVGGPVQKPETQLMETAFCVFSCCIASLKRTMMLALSGTAVAAESGVVGVITRGCMPSWLVPVVNMSAEYATSESVLPARRLPAKSRAVPVIWSM